jgi:hypothetical protein
LVDLKYQIAYNSGTVNSKETAMKVIYNRLLNGWYIVRGAHQTPISGRFDTKEAALAHLRRRNPLHYQ